MKSSAMPIPFAGSELNESRHVCAFFNNEDDEYRILLPFIRDGLERGDKAVHILNPGQRDNHARRLDEVGIDCRAAEERGQLEIRTNTEEYLRDDRFDQDRMLETFEQMAVISANEGYPMSRIVCRMDWASEGSSHIDDVIEFESRVNDVWSRSYDAVICTYHLQKFGGETVVDIMRTHPMIIIGGLLQQNPFYTPPNIFLRELHERRRKRNVSLSNAL